MTMPKIHVKKGDTVVVLTGKDAGKKGKVIEVLPRKGRLTVEGVNVVKRHSKPSQTNPQGGIIEKEASLNSSNVMLQCPRCHEATRIAKKLLDTGKYVRQCKKCGEVIDK